MPWRRRRPFPGVGRSSGAVVVSGGQIVGRGWNRNIADRDPSAHAEILALREAGTAVGNHRLGDCELFVTIEPCAMCAGALVQAPIKRLIYRGDHPQAGAAPFVVLGMYRLALY